MYTRIYEKVFHARRDEKQLALWQAAYDKAVEWAKEAGIRAVAGSKKGKEDEEQDEEQQEESDDDAYGK